MPLNNLGIKMIKKITKITLVSALLFSTVLNADFVKRNTLACPTIKQLQNAPLDTTENYMELSMYAIANNCEILVKRDKIQAVGYDPRNSKEIYQEIIYKKTGKHLFLQRKAIQIEQGGKKNRYRF